MVVADKGYQKLSDNHRTMAAELEWNIDLRNRKLYRSILSSGQGPTVPLLGRYIDLVIRH